MKTTIILPFFPLKLIKILSKWVKNHNFLFYFSFMLLFFLLNRCISLSQYPINTILRGYTSNKEIFLSKISDRLQSQQNSQEEIRQIILSPDGTKLATTGNDGIIILWNIINGTIIRKFIGHNQIVNSMAFSPDGTMLLSGSDDGTVRLWDIQSGNLIKSIDETEKVYSVAFHPDGTKIACTGYFGVIRLRSTGGNLLKTFSFTNKYGMIYFPVIYSFAISPDGTKIAAAISDGTLKVIDLQADTIIYQYTDSEAELLYTFYSYITFFPDGKHIAAITKYFNSPERLEFFQFELIKRFVGYRSYYDFTSFAISKDGKIIAFGKKDRIELFCVNYYYYNTTQGIIFINDNSPTSLCFTKDGNCITSGGIGWKIFSLMDIPVQLILSTNQMAFSAIKSKSIPESQNISISKSGFKDMNWNISTNANWIEVYPNSGKNDGTVNVKINTTEMEPKFYNTILTITSPDITNSPSSVNVYYTLNPNYTLSQNFSNPFNTYTFIRFSLSVSTPVNLTIYNSLGQEIETLVNNKFPPGTFGVYWYPRGVPSGVYFYRLKTDYFTDTKKMLYIRKDGNIPIIRPWK
jgi:WD40 repeat protein